jgi:peptidylprolyl isomerase
MKVTFSLLLTFILCCVHCLTGLQANEENGPMPNNSQPIVEIETNFGNFEVALRPDIAPKATQNFIKLAEEGYYNNVIFHRVIKGFMIQGGDPTGTGRGGRSIWEAPFEDEFSDSVKFDRPGILAMANAGRNTNGSQFFITTAPVPWLNNKHTIFGEVVKGYDVVQKIESTKTSGDRPVQEVKILHMTVKNVDPKGEFSKKPV